MALRPPTFRFGGRLRGNRLGRSGSRKLLVFLRLGLGRATYSHFGGPGVSLRQGLHLRPLGRGPLLEGGAIVCLVEEKKG